MFDLTRGERIPTDLDAEFSLTIYEWYRVTCSVEAVPGPGESYERGRESRWWRFVPLFSTTPDSSEDSAA